MQITFFTRVLTFTAFVACCVSTAMAQIGDPGGGDEVDPILFYGVNNSGFIQNGPGGSDNLILFEVVPIEGDEEGEPIPVEEVPEILFSVVGNLDGDDNDGLSIGTFSGLEWSTGEPGVGTLIGCVLNDGAGSGEFYQINPNTGSTTLIGNSPDGVEFSDLAFNPVDGLMYGLRNDVTDDGDGDLEFGLNTIWLDSDGDLIPDTPLGSRIFIDPFCFVPLTGLASGLAFNSQGLVFLYDNVQELVLAGGVDSDFPAISPCINFPLGASDLDNQETRQGNGLSVIGTQVFMATDTEVTDLRNTVISFFNLPPPKDAPPPVYAAGRFPFEFFQNNFQGSASIGDLVPAMADLSNLPSTFPDSVVVNRGTPGENAILEALVVSDNFRYCISPEPSPPKVAPIDLTFAFTVPNPSNVTLLGVEIESMVNTPNVEHLVKVLNVNTGEFDEIDSAAVSIGSDGDFTVDLSTTISDYLNTSSGTLTVRIATRPVGPVLFFPWQLKYDSIFAVAE